MTTGVETSSHDAAGEPRRSKGYALATYETMLDFRVALARMEEMLRGLVDRQKTAEVERTDGHGDHETRLRALERQVTTMSSAGGAAHRTWLFVFGVLIGLPGFITSIVSLIVLLRQSGTPTP